MPDLPGLPPRRVPPPFEPPEGSADRAVSRGAARRRRAAFSAATVSGAAALAVATAISGPNAPRGSLDAAHDPPASPPLAASASPAPARQPSETPATSAPPASGATRPSATPTHAATPAPTPDEPRSEPDGSSGMRRAETAYDVGSCQDRASRRTARGWCLGYAGASSGRAGSPVVLGVELCRLPGFGDGTARFGSSRQADFTVSTRGSGAREVWRWSHGRAFSEAIDELEVAEGRCARWTTVWHVTGNDGRPLARGTYSLLPQVTAYDLGDEDYLTESFAFTVS